MSRALGPKGYRTVLVRFSTSPIIGSKRTGQAGAHRKRPSGEGQGKTRLSNFQSLGHRPRRLRPPSGGF